MNDLQKRIFQVMSQDYTHPMVTIYAICARLGERQERSTNKFYVKVYRNVEKLVEQDKVWVMRGTRDPSVYLCKSMVKGYTIEGEWELPF